MWRVEGIESITKSVSSSKGKFGGIYKKNDVIDTYIRDAKARRTYHHNGKAQI